MHDSSSAAAGDLTAIAAAEAPAAAAASVHLASLRRWASESPGEWLSWDAPAVIFLRYQRVKRAVYTTEHDH